MTKIIQILFFFAFLASFGARAETVSLQSLKELRNAQPASKLDGRVFVYFWASWCPDCREKLGGPLAKFAKDNPGVNLVTVNSDRDEAKGAGYVDGEKISLAVYRDTDRTLSKSLKIFAVPAWAILDKKGDTFEVVASSTGSDLAVIQQKLKR